MAQYYFDFGKIVPKNIVDGTEFSGLVVKDVGGLTDFPLISSSSIYDSYIGENALQFNPIDNAGEGSENNVKTTFSLLFNEKISNFEALIRGRSCRQANWGSINSYSGGLGFSFRLPNLHYEASSSVDFSKGGVVFSASSIGNDSAGASRTMRLYSAGYTSSSAATTGSTYLSLSASNSRHRYFVNIRIKVEGNNIKVRSWMSDVLEPTTWGIDYDATNMPSEGYLGLRLSTWIEGRVIDFMSIGTDGDSPPANPTLYNVVGTLLNPDNSLAINKKVRLYDKQTGALIEETLTDNEGAYSFSQPILPTNLVQIVGVDQDNNEWKPPIHETYPVL